MCSADSTAQRAWSLQFGSPLASAACSTPRITAESVGVFGSMVQRHGANAGGLHGLAMVAVEAGQLGALTAIVTQLTDQLPRILPALTIKARLEVLPMVQVCTAMSCLHGLQVYCCQRRASCTAVHKQEKSYPSFRLPLSPHCNHTNVHPA